MTFNMVNICVQKKIPKICHICKNCEIVVHARKHVFLFLKFSRKPTSPAMRNNEFISRSLTLNQWILYTNSMDYLYNRLSLRNSINYLQWCIVLPDHHHPPPPKKKRGGGKEAKTRKNQTCLHSCMTTFV